MGDGYEWVDCHNFRVPHDAVKCGTDKDGSDIYIGLTRFQNDELPVKVVPRRNEAYVSYEGKEQRVNQFRVLCPKMLQWVPCENGRVPPGAIPAGRTSSGETLYVGRTKMSNVTVVGKVHGSHGCLYVPYNGQEVSHKHYEVLVLKR